MKRRTTTAVATAFLVLLLLNGCSEPRSHAKAVYMLLDTSGTYTEEIDKARTILSYLVATLDSGDSLGVARIDSRSFSEKDIVARTTFDSRPSVASQQKREFIKTIDNFRKSVKGSPYTDISGGLLQAVEYLEETGAGHKYVLIFSDLAEDLKKGDFRDFPIPLDGIHVIALNVTKLRSDNVDPRKYLDRLTKWQDRVSSNGGEWRVVNDLDHVGNMLDS